MSAELLVSILFLGCLSLVLSLIAIERRRAKALRAPLAGIGVILLAIWWNLFVETVFPAGSWVRNVSIRGQASFGIGLFVVGMIVLIAPFNRNSVIPKLVGFWIVIVGCVFLLIVLGQFVRAVYAA